ncbi:hypothetical protein ACI2K4_06165 [Micromonospora sp. NPDC050397]|uniref:hypothetical protein n=1 Tax=Micromonospora sp. NPDC050397 TaxID=3364279 RepID=UPI00384B48E4
MAAVTLTRPLWWVARRSLRLLTGLILMALLLGLGAGASEAAPSSGPPAAASVSAYSVSASPVAASSVSAWGTAGGTVAELSPGVAESPTGVTVRVGGARADRTDAGVDGTDAGVDGTDAGVDGTDAGVDGTDAAAALGGSTPVGHVGPDRRSTAAITAEAVVPGGPGHPLPTGQRAPPTR